MFKRNKMNFEFLSKKATKQITQQINKLNQPGGLIHAYDDESRSLINLCVKKQAKDFEILSWSVYGPMTMDDAAREVAQNMSVPVAKDPVKFH